MANQFINNMTALWNSAGTVYTSILMNVTNAASGAGSLLFDLRLSDISKFRVSKEGNVVAAGSISSTGLSTTDNYITVGPATADTTAGLARTIKDGSLSFYGGTAGSTGSYITLYGEEHTTKARDIEIGTESILKYQYDYSEDKHYFKNRAGTVVVTITNTGLSTTGLSTTDTYIPIGPSTPADSSAGIARPTSDGTLALYGGQNSGTGAYILLYGETHGAIPGGYSPTSRARDIIIGTESGARYIYDYSVNTHSWYNNSLNPQVRTMLLDGAGTLTTTANINCVDVHAVRSGGTTGVIYLGNQLSGPSGAAKAAFLYYDGDSYSLPSAPLTVGGALTSTGTQTIHSGNIAMSGTSNYLSMTDTNETGGAKTRHVHHNSGLIGFLGSGGSWAMNTNDAGDTTVYGQLNVDSIVQSTDTTLYLCSASGGSIRLKPNGKDSTVEEAYLTTTGSLTLNPSAGTGLYVNRPTTTGYYGVRAYGQTDAAGVIGYSATVGAVASVYGMLGFYDVATGTDPVWSFYGNGIGRTSGGWQTSDQRLKSEIADCDCGEAYDKVRAIGVKSYRKVHAVRGRNYDEMGFLAQDIEAVIPEAVMDAGIPKDDLEERKRVGGDTVKLTNDHTLLAHLWAAVQHQAHIIDDLNLKIEALGGNR